MDGTVSVQTAGILVSCAWVFGMFSGALLRDCLDRRKKPHKG